MNHCRRRCVAALVIAFFICGPAIAAEQFVNVLTGGTSGVYYPLGVALANVIGKELPNVKTSAQATKASVENLNLPQAGRGEVAFTLGDSLSDAWKGNEEAGFKSPLKKLRGIAAIYPITSRSSRAPTQASRRLAISRARRSRSVRPSRLTHSSYVPDYTLCGPAGACRTLAGLVGPLPDGAVVTVHTCSGIALLAGATPDRPPR